MCYGALRALDGPRGTCFTSPVNHDGERPAVLPAHFRELVSAFASGVTVVTTLGEGERPWGFTATSFASVSLEPPLILVILDVKADCHPAFQACAFFSVNILGEGQDKLAMNFASKGTDKFARVPLAPSGRFPPPLLDGAHAHIECEVFARHVAGDHTILIGKVLGGQRFDRPPLLHYHRAFGGFSRSSPL